MPRVATASDTFADALASAKDLFELLLLTGEESLLAAAPSSSTAIAAREYLIESFRKVLAQDGDGRILSLSDRQIADLCRIARDAAKLRGSPFAADAFVSACDVAFGANLARLFESRSLLEVAPGRVFPFPSFSLKATLKNRRLLPHPNRRNQPHTRRNHVEVMPTTQYRVVFDFSRTTLLNDFRTRPVIAVLSPNKRLAEFDCECDEALRRFFDVRPRDEEAQFSEIVRQLGTARAANASAAILPELSVTRTMIKRLGHEACEKHSLLLAAGSYHGRHDNGDGFNRLEMHTSASSSPAVHDKLNPFELREWQGKRFQPPLTEDIAGPPTVVVHWSLGRSLVTLICKDLIADETKRLLVKLRPSLVFVAALSMETSVFLTAAEQLAADCHACVVVANFAGESEQALGAIAALPVCSSDDPNRPLSITGKAREIAKRVAIVDLLEPELGWQIR